MPENILRCARGRPAVVRGISAAISGVYRDAWVSTRSKPGPTVLAFPHLTIWWRSNYSAIV